MIGLKSTLNVIDNSGALLVECVNILKQKVNNGWGSVGDEIVCVVQRARPVSAATQVRFLFFYSTVLFIDLLAPIGLSNGSKSPPR